MKKFFSKIAKGFREIGKGFKKFFKSKVGRILGTILLAIALPAVGGAIFGGSQAKKAENEILAIKDEARAKNAETRQEQLEKEKEIQAKSQKEVEEKAKPKKRKSTKKRDENGKFVKADES